MPEAASLWCDLGINYYRQCQKLLNQEQDIQMLLEKSLQVRKALQAHHDVYPYLIRGVFHAGA